MDNDDSSRQSLAIWVEMTCCDVIESKSGERSLALAVEKEPKLILMDMALPGMDGFEAAKQISSHSATNHIPIVAMSTPDTGFNWRQKARSVGCIECVSKPLTFEVISDLVDRYVPA